MSLLTQFIGGMVLVRKQQLFTAGGTWTRPAAMVGNTVIVSGIGGGASGNSSTDPSGGNSGQAAQLIPVDIGVATSVSVTVGAAAAGVNGSGVNTAGLPGSPSSFGAFITMNGGTANNANGSISDPGLGVSGSYDPATFSIFVLPSYLGPFAAPARAPQDFRARSAGAAGLIFNALDVGGVTLSASHQGGMGYGAGGASSGNNSVTSGAGAPGAVYLEWDEVVTL